MGQEQALNLGDRVRAIRDAGCRQLGNVTAGTLGTVVRTCAGGTWGDVAWDGGPTLGYSLDWDEYHHYAQILERVA